MKETNATFIRLFETKGVGADLNAIASGSICLPSDCDSPEDSQTVFTRLAVGADRKAIEALRGSGPCSPWCEKCGREVQHVLPWPRGAHPPITMAEYRERKSRLVQVTRPGGKREWVGCSSTFLPNELIREAGHVPQKGAVLPRFCRWCQKVRTPPQQKVTQLTTPESLLTSQVPYASVPEMQAAKARLLALKASACKKDRNTHDRERSSHSSTHAHQHEFCWLWLDLDMDDVVPEWMHVLDLNDAFLFFKHVTLKHCDPFTREWVAHFHTGQFAPHPPTHS